MQARREAMAEAKAPWELGVMGLGVAGVGLFEFLQKGRDRPSEPIELM